jgi:hypothetical protein
VILSTRIAQKMQWLLLAIMIGAQLSVAFMPLHFTAPADISHCAQNFYSGSLRSIHTARAGIHFEKTSRVCLNLLPPSEVLDENKRVLYTAIYAAGHSLIAVPFLFFWKVEPAVKLRTAAFAFPVLALWIALLGGWLRFN